MVYHANVLKIIGKTYFEGEGLATCAHQFNTSNICKHNTEGMLHAENNPQYFGSPPLLGEDWSGLNASMVSTNKKVTGVTNNVLRKENWQNATAARRSRDHIILVNLLRELFFQAELPPPGKHRNNMCLTGLEVHHPAYETLLNYTTGGCPVKTGRYWVKEETHVAVMRVPHESALAEDTISHFAAESKVKVASKWARLVLYDDIKGNIPKN